MFAFMYSAQDEGQRLVGDAIATYTNSFLEQREQEGMISLSDRITAESLMSSLRRLGRRDLIGGIIRNKGQ